jgi:hypothetical protein
VVWVREIPLTRSPGLLSLRVTPMHAAEVDNSRTRHRSIEMIAATGTLDIYWVCVPAHGHFNRGPQALHTGLASPMPTGENPCFIVDYIKIRGGATGKS